MKATFTLHGGLHFSVASFLGSMGALLGVVLIVTSSARAVEACPNEQLRLENNSAQLPDCRAYEMVTPDFTGGFRVLAGGATPATSTSGAVYPDAAGADIFLGSSFGAFAGAENNKPLVSEYQFNRTLEGWRATPLDPPVAQLPSNFSDNEAVSADLRSTVNAFSTAPQQSTFTPDFAFYLRGPSGHFEAVGPAVPPGSLEHQGGPNVEFKVLGASADLSHFLFYSNDNEIRGGQERFWAGDETLDEHPSLYEYAYSGTAKPTPIMVGVSGGSGSHALVTQCGTSLGGGTNSIGTIEGQGSQYNAVSAAGATVFFSAAPGGCEAINPQSKVEEEGQGPSVLEVYARRNASDTVAISEPTTGAGGDCEACQEGSRKNAKFLAASADGSRVLFSTTQQLLPADTDSTSDLYEYDFEAPAGHRVIQVSAGGVGDPHLGAGAEVQGLVTVSPDLSHVYFVAKGVLSTEKNNLAQEAKAGQDNLYVYEPDPAHPGQSKTVFVATLATGVCPFSGPCSGDAEDWRGFHEGYNNASEVTPGGRYLVFPSATDLTPGDTSSASQLFRYDSQTGELIRVTIGQEGYGDIQGGYGPNGNATVPVGTEALQSTDGAHVFFDSTVPLVPVAAASAGFNSVYEWTADGAGSCREAQGCVYLISDGRDTGEEGGSLLGGVSPTGSDIYFRTVDALLSSDTNNQESIYDARVGGGFPLPAEPSSCAGDACQGQPSSPPAAQAPASSGLSGSGNLAPPSITTVTPKKTTKKTTIKCVRGKKLSHGKCVKTKTKGKKPKAKKTGGNDNRRMK